MDDDLFGEDVWGEEPDWAKGEDEQGGDGAEDDFGTSSSLVGAQHVILLVDCHADMFHQLQLHKEGDCNTPMALALHLTQKILQKRIRDTVTLKIGKRNGVGLLLYNTTKKRGQKQSQVDLEYSEEEEEEFDDDEKEDDEEQDSDDEANEGSTVHVLLPLDPPGISQVQTIRQCITGERDLYREFASDHGDQDEERRIAPLQTALEESLRIFRKAKCVRQKQSKPSDAMDTKSIWIFTNRENPYPNSSHLIQNVARDAKEQGIQIVVWPLPSPSSSTGASLEEFRSELFFHDIVSYVAFPRRFYSLEDLEDGLDDLQQQWKKIRRVYWGPMLLPDWRERNEDDPQIMIDWFRFVQLAKKPSKVPIDQETKRDETIKLRQLVDDRGRIIASFKMGDAASKSKPQVGLTRLRQYAKFGGELIPISKDDIAQIRYHANGRRDKTGLILLGFKQKDSIPFYHTMGPTYLIYPNDEFIKGSREAFVELHGAMLRKNVLAIGEVLHRKEWTSRLVAITPIEEIKDESEQEGTSRQKRPPGMLVTTLPFEDDMRVLESDAANMDQSLMPVPVKSDSMITANPDQVFSTEAAISMDHQRTLVSEELVTAMMGLIGRQRLEGMELGEDFENAALTEFFNYLESVALEIPVSDKKEDFDTRLDDSVVLEAARDQVEKLQQYLPEDSEKPKSSGIRKRKLVADDSGLDWEHLYRSNSIGDCKVPELKKYLRSVGESLTGNKAVLVQRVQQHLHEALEQKQPKPKT